MHTPLRIFIVLLLFVTASVGKIQAQQAKIKFFEGNFSELLLKAKEERKYVFIYLYGVPCHYCSFMDTTVFTDYKVYTLQNRHFINYKLNVSQGDFGYFDLIDAYGEQIINAKAGYPVLLYLDTEGRILKREQGGQTISKFLAYADEVLYRPQGVGIVAEMIKKPEQQYNWSANDHFLPPPSNNEIDRFAYSQVQNQAQAPPPPTQEQVLRPNKKNEPKDKNKTTPPNSPAQTFTPPVTSTTSGGFKTPPELEADYKKLNELSIHFRSDTTLNAAIIREYAYLLLKLQQPINAVVNYYLKLEQYQLNIPYNRDFIYDFSINLENKAIDYLVSDIQYYKSTKGGNKVNEKIKNAIEYSVLTAIKEKDQKLFTKAEKVIKESYLPDRNRFLFDMQSLYYQGIQDWNTYAKLAADYLTANQISEPKILADIAAVFQRNVNNKRMLQKALVWVEQSINIEQEYYNHFIQALLLYRLNQKDKARKAAQNAMYIASLRNDGADVSPCRHFLDRLESSN